MKKNTIIIVGILIISSFITINNTTAQYKTNSNQNENNNYIETIDDISTRIYQNMLKPVQNDNYQDFKNTFTNLRNDDYPIGTTIWQYTISGGSDNSPKAISPIPDINNDGTDDVVICSEDNNIRCFDGAAIGTGNVLWTHNIYSGNIYNQNGISLLNDINDDDIPEVVVGATGGARLIRCISGETGQTIWSHDTHEYGGGGWVYMVDCKYDYNDDEINDVLAAVGDDSSDTGPNRVYCLDGETGVAIWEYPLGGPGFAVIGVNDFTGDDKPDAIAGCSNSDETIGYAKGIDGDTGDGVWIKATPGSSVWALEQTDDFTSDGIKDIIIGDFLTGNIFGLDATNGNVEYSLNIGSGVITTRFAKLTDVNNDGHPDFVPAHSSVKATQAIDGQTGNIIWAHATVDQPWNAARSNDISGDGIDDVVIGTLYTTNYYYFLNGATGAEVYTSNYGQPVDAIMTIPDVTGDYSMEMVAGGREGKVTCISGGMDTLINEPPEIPVIDGPKVGTNGITYQFTFYSMDSDNDQVSIHIIWDDGTEENTNMVPSGQEILINHIYQNTGIYQITAKAKDEHNYQSEYSDPYEIQIIENNPPAAPIINGPNQGKPNKEQTFKITVTDPENNQIYLYIDWGDGNIQEWLGPYNSQEEITLKHTWIEKNTYTIKAKAKDTLGEEGDLKTFDINIPRNKQNINTLFSKLTDKFTILINIIQQILKF